MCLAPALALQQHQTCARRHGTQRCTEPRARRKQGGPQTAPHQQYVIVNAYSNCLKLHRLRSSVLEDGLSPTHSIAAADTMSANHGVHRGLHRGVPTNSSINIPVNVKPLGASADMDGVPPMLMGRPVYGANGKANGATSTGRRLPNLAKFYGHRQGSTESQQYLQGSLDSRESSGGPRGGPMQNHMDGGLRQRRYIFANRK